MANERSSLARAIRGLFAGAALGCLLTAVDGLLCGLILAGPSSRMGILAWVGGFALAGAIVGGLIGVAVGLMGSRLVLRPPEENKR